MLYILRTNSLANNFGMDLLPLGDTYTAIDLRGYERKAKLAFDKSIEGKLNTYILSEPADFKAREKSSEIQGRSLRPRLIDPKKIPDFWELDPLPVVSSTFKSLLEQQDDLEHQYYPIEVYQQKTGEKLKSEKSYYFFVCCRLVNIWKSRLIPAKGSVVPGGGLIREDQLPYYKTVQDNVDVQKLLTSFPIARDYKHRTIHYLNETFLSACQAEGLKGFAKSSVTTKGLVTRRDVGYVRY